MVCMLALLAATRVGAATSWWALFRQTLFRQNHDAPQQPCTPCSDSPLESSGVVPIVTDADMASDGRPRWGLPTKRCPASKFMLDVYPRRVAGLRRQGRNLYYCSFAPLGNYLQGVPNALVAAMSLDLALVLACPQRDMQGPQQWQHTQGPRERFFTGPHFDWHGDGMGDGSIVSSARNVTLVANAKNWSGAHADLLGLLEDKSPPHHVIYHSSTCHGGCVRAMLQSPGMLHGEDGCNRSTPCRRLQEHVSSLLGPFYTDSGTHMGELIDGCLLHYLFSPTGYATHLLSRQPRLPPTSQTSGLMRAITTHVRLGDHFLTERDPSTTWYARGQGGRSKAYSNNVSHAWECVAKFSRVGHQCLPCVVVADAEEVKDDAHKFLPKPIFTSGVAIHQSAASESEQTLDNEDKTLLDWWLMARSEILVKGGGSSFSDTADMFKKAGSNAGRTIVGFPC